MAATERMERDLMRRSEKTAQKTNNPIERLRAMCLSRGAAGIKGLGRLFRIMDDDGNKMLSFSEFKKGLNDYGIFLDTDDEYHDVFDRFDLNHDGTLAFDEFLISLRPAISNHRKRLIQMAFNKVDKDGNGVLTAEDLVGVYKVESHPKYLNGEMTRDEIYEEFLSTFELNGVVDGQVTWEEFFNYYTGVSASIDEDCYFDLMMRKAWRLDEAKKPKRRVR